ncbi:MAG: hypothetical protein KME11_09780 [Timaviella obliquedivisa GSE-PSE-MK23-08B]|nr:hypothetical protein [Timaviella obliquedivisa GSE-PSE-MK23-08B]
MRNRPSHHSSDRPYPKIKTLNIARFTTPQQCLNCFDKQSHFPIPQAIAQISKSLSARSHFSSHQRAASQIPQGSLTQPKLRPPSR